MLGSYIPRFLLYERREMTVTRGTKLALVQCTHDVLSQLALKLGNPITNSLILSLQCLITQTQANFLTVIFSRLQWFCRPAIAV